MAGGAIVSTGKSGRKALDAAINLVPFIDLLSCCLSFLLITAVWSQLAAVPTTHGGKGGEAESKEIALTLFVHTNGFRLDKSNGEPVTIEDRADRRDLVQLAAIMEQLRKDYPDKQDITLRADDSVVYQRVVEAMDVLRGASFDAIQVSGNDSPESGSRLLHVR